MLVQNDLSSESLFVHKAVFAIRRVVTRPRASLSWVLRGHLAKDPVFVDQMWWSAGKLPRVSLTSILPGVENVEVNIPRAFDREPGTSISVSEACHLAAITKWKSAARVLEIGTADGHSALLLAANLPTDGICVTVDLPPDFDREKQASLKYSGSMLNLTPRDRLGRQYRGHPLSLKISQVYGDSATLDWSALGGPFDLIFVDGCHSEAYVWSDSQNAIRHLSPGGTIVWHDYGNHAAVSNVVDRLACEFSNLMVYVLEGTRLAIGITQPVDPVDSNPPSEPQPETQHGLGGKLGT